MAKVLRRTWRADPAAGLGRRDREGCSYEAYVPDELRGRTVALEGQVAADVADAETAITRLDTSARVLVDTEALARLLLRAEAVASSRIEGLEIGPRRLLRAEAGSALDLPVADVTAEEVLGNVRAMSWAVSGLSSAKTIRTEQILKAHRLLLERTRLSEHAGRIRDVQNWIGGSSYNPCSAAFVPPPPEYVRPLLDDLCKFMNDDSLSPVVQAAITHAQFETIHPFVDGNGRIGRALIHVVLRRRGLAQNVLPPVSLVLATLHRSYVEGLMATRYRAPSASLDAHEGMNKWIGTFAAACRRAVGDAITFEAKIVAIEKRWRSKLGRLRKGSAAEALLAALPGAPVMTTNSAAELIGRSFQATNEAMSRLVDSRILTQRSLGRRNRVFEANDVIEAFMDLERRLSSPEADTRTSPPSRRVPRRR